MKKAVALALMLLPFLTMLVGCAPSVRLEERLIIRGMAVDFDEEYIVTVQSYRSKEEGGEEFDLISARGESVYEALGRLEEVSGRLPFYSELAMIVVGDEAVQRGLYELLSGFVRENEIRMGVYVFYAEGAAAELLTVQGGSTHGEELISVAKAQLSDPVLDASRLYNVVGRIHGEGEDALLPVLYTREDEGGATYMADRVLCFSGNTPAIMLDADQTETLGWALGGTSTRNVFIHDSTGRTVFFRPVSAKNRIQFSVNDTALSLRLDLSQSLEFLPLNPGTMTNKEQDQLMEEARLTLADEMQRRVDELIDLVLGRSGSDVFLFGVHLRQQQPGFWKQQGEKASQSVLDCTREVVMKLQIGEG